MNSSANWRISTTGWVPSHNGRLDQRSDSDTNGRKLTGVAILFKPGQIFVTHWIFGSSAKQAKQGWQGLEMQLERAFLGAACSIVGNFWPPSPIGAIWVRAFGPVLLISPGNSAQRWEYFWSPKKYLWPGVLAVRNTLIEKNTVVPVHGDCLDNQSIDQAKQKEVNQTHGHGLISSDLSFNCDPVTHCHCYSCCRKMWLTILFTI